MALYYSYLLTFKYITNLKDLNDFVDNIYGNNFGGFKILKMIRKLYEFDDIAEIINTGTNVAIQQS